MFTVFVLIYMNHSVEEYPEEDECEESISMWPCERVSLWEITQPVSLCFYVPYQRLNSNSDEVENEAVEAGETKYSFKKFNE